ncbi:MAG: 30S ribosome-binding factor RbfA [Alphaproteobacteria bacterium]|nr:30S ribosome-binding factor RbfA [Alphaproteobacteria bacterium]
MNKNIFNSDIIKSNKPKSNRGLKIAKEIRVILSDIFTKSQLKDEALFDKIVLITGVEVSGDLSIAKIYISNWNVAMEGKLLIAALNKYIPFMRNKIAKVLKIKVIPNLVFIIDDQFDKMEESAKMFQALENSKKHDS